MVQSHFSLHHEPVDDFFRPQWTKEPRNYGWCVFRWLIAVYYTVTIVGSMAQLFRDGMWFIFLTNWVMAICTVVLNLGAILTTLYCCNKLRIGGDSVLLKLYWFLYTTNIVLAPMISTVYWGLIWRIVQHDLSWVNVTAHLLNTVVPLMDFFISAIPIRVMHALYVVVVGLVYAVFALVYQYCGGRNPWGDPFIYPLIDYTKPTVTVLTVAILSCFVLLNGILLFWLSQCRDALAKKLKWPNTDEVDR